MTTSLPVGPRPAPTQPTDGWVRSGEQVGLDDAIMDPNVREVMLLSGRRFTELGLRRGGQKALGQMTLVNLKSKELVTVIADEIIPEGLWLPANHLPAPLLRELEQKQRAKKKAQGAL